MTLEEDIKATNSIAQISSLSGEEILCTCSEDGEKNTHLNKLTNAYIELETMAKTLKLGSIQQVITGSKDNSTFTVQSKSSKENNNNSSSTEEENEDALLNTVIGDSLQGALVADGIVRETTQQIL